MQKRKEKGITLVVLVITVMLMLILVTVTVSISTDRYTLVKINNMYSDIEQLKDKVDLYYLNNNELPIIENKTQDVSKMDADVFNLNDNSNYYIIDFDKLDLQNINYGYGYSKIKNGVTSDDIYIINENSHTIYYYAGVTYKGETYYRKMIDEQQISDNIPPSKPEINIVSGTINEEEIYTTEVEIEVIPGNDNWSGVEKTTYVINNGEEIDISTLTNNIYRITEGGTYEIKAYTYDNNGNKSENSITIQLDLTEQS